MNLNDVNPVLSITTRSSLLERLKSMDDEESWREFCRIYGDLIRRLAMKAGLTEHEAEEVLQEVLISVVRNIGGFTYNPAVSSFRHWLTNVVRWRIADQRKKQSQHERIREEPLEDGEQAGVAGGLADPAGDVLDAQLEAEWRKGLIETALGRIKRQVNPKHFQIYHLLVVHELPVPQVCRRLKVNRGQLYLARHRIARLLQKEVKRLAAREGE